MAWRTLPHMLPTRTLCRVEQVDGVARHAEAGDEDPRAAVDHRLRSGSTCPGRAVSRSTPNGLAVSSRTSAISSASSSSPIVQRPERAEAAGLADRGDEAVVAHPAHAGEHHRVLDVEQVGQARAHGRAPYRGAHAIDVA